MNDVEDEALELALSLSDGYQPPDRPDRDFLRAVWSYNNKRYRLKADPNVVVDMTRNVDETSVLLGTWSWVGPTGEPHGPFLTVEAMLRDMNKRFGLRQMVNPRHWWRGCARSVGGPQLRLVPPDPK